MLDSSKTIQESDIPVKLIKEGSDLFAETFVNILMNPQKKVSFQIV